MISLHRVSRLKKKYGGRCDFRHTEAGGQPSSKKSKKSGGQGSAALVKENFQMGCVFQDNPQKKVYCAGSWKIGIKSRSQVLQDHDASRVKIWERKDPSQEVVQKCAPKERPWWAPKFKGKNAKRNPGNRSDASAETHGI